DGAGRYRLDGIDPGERDVRFDLGEDRASFHQVRIVAGENRLDLTLVRQVVRGRVRNPEGEPVAGAWVRLSGTAGAHVAITGADGTFAFKTLAGWFRLDACKDGYVSFR